MKNNPAGWLPDCLPGWLAGLLAGSNWLGVARPGWLGLPA